MTVSKQPKHIPESQPGNYNVYITGELVEGFDSEQVKASLAKLFKRNPDHVEKMLSGKPIAIRRDVDKPQANKLVAVLAKAGAIAVIKKAAQMPAPKGVSNDIVRPDTKPVDVGDKSRQQEQITCPRCGHEQSFTTACTLCKMDLRLHIQRMQRKAKIRAFQQRS